jgi:hypothetical protein
MKTQLITALVSALFSVITTEKIKKFIDAGLDVIEDSVSATESKWDDLIVLPICNQLRKALDIPDDDEDI